MDEPENELKVNKASGPDDMPVFILNELSEDIAPKLTALYTQSIQNTPCLK